MTTTNDTWDKLPEAKIRIREGGLELLLKSLQDGGMLITGRPSVRLIEGGIYIEFPSNASSGNRMEFLGIDIFIPVVEEQK